MLDHKVEQKQDTKSLIFDTALRLFATSGVENVSMRDLADAVGIKAASIYNHYTNKEQLVEACYDFYINYHDACRLSKDHYEDILLHGTREDIANVPSFPFPEELRLNLLYAMTVLFSRMYTDPKAIDRYSFMIDRSMRFLSEFFEMGIRLGRFEPFDVSSFCMLFLSARLFSAQSTTIRPASLPDLDTVQSEMITALTRLIPFRY